MSDVKAVLISDLHFTPSTLALASSALTQALDYAYAKQAPCIIAGDLLDTKDILRGVVINRLLEIFSKTECADVFVFPGNHDQVNEKSDEHTLHFLDHRVTLIHKPRDLWICGHSNNWAIPYQHDTEKLIKILSEIPDGATVFCHQGIQGADMGHYVQDKTSLSKEHFARFRTISGHYHKAQDIKCGRPRKGAVGLFSYIGSPYTITFGEANDGPKGFRVLRADGTLALVPTNLRKHVVIPVTLGEETPIPTLAPEDLVWVKLTGPTSELSSLTKPQVRELLALPSENFRLDKVYTDAPKLEVKTEKMTDLEILDSLIDNTNESAEQKAAIKDLARRLLETT